MGGYGATRIGMKHPTSSASLYIMSPCCMSPRPAGQARNLSRLWEAVKTPEDSAKLPFFARAQLASAAAWSPDPKNPPLYLDLPTKDGVPNRISWPNGRPMRRWLLWISTSGISSNFRAIAIDVGDQDSLRTDTALLHDALDRYHIVHQFEIYSGTHVSEVAIRFQDHVMPFFSENLCFQASCQ